MSAGKSWWLLNFVCAAAWACAACATNATGDWGGLLPDPLRVIVHIRESEAKYAATVEIPDETDEIFHPTITVSPRRLRMTIKSIPMEDGGKSVPAQYDGHWDDAQGAWIGTWSLGTTTEPLVLKRVDKAAIDAMAPRRPQEAAIAAAPLPYTQEEVHFESSAGHVILAGTFTRPAGPGPFPAVLLITGAGIQNRDALVYQHQTHLLLADDLTRRGIATLRYDKRGLFASGGDFKRATLQDLVADASSALRYLESRREVDVHHVGLIGHSQGGWIAPRVAVSDSAVAFVVMMAAPATGSAQGAVLRRLTVPVLALNGSLDHQVISKPNLAAIREALRDNRDATVMELPGINHMFTTARTGSEWEYVMIEESFAPAALKIIGDWVVDRAK